MCLTAFLVDAISIVYQIKRILITVVTCFLAVAVTRQYFIYPDVLYNPCEKYNFKHAQISLKSICIGSYCNIILFMANPLFADVKDWFKLLVKDAKYNCKDDHDHDHDSNCDNTKHDHYNGDKDNHKGFERLVSVYAKPKVKWNNKSISGYNQTEMVVKHLSDE